MGTVGAASENTGSTVPLVFVPQPGEGGGGLAAQGGVGVGEWAAGQAALEGGDGPCLVLPPPPPVVVFDGVLRPPVTPLPGRLKGRCHFLHTHTQANSVSFVY